MTDRGSLELTAHDLVEKVAPEIRDLRRLGVGCCLLVFDFEPGGNAAFVSGSRRTDLVRVAASLVLEAAAGRAGSVFDRERAT